MAGGRIVLAALPEEVALREVVPTWQVDSLEVRVGMVSSPAQGMTVAALRAEPAQALRAEIQAVMVRPPE